MRTCKSIWPPVLKNLKAEVNDGDGLVLAFSPFIRSEALEVFLDTFPAASTRIVVRWRVEDLLSGASDLEAFDVLEAKGIPMYLHQAIHLKLFQFSSGYAYSGSSNITSKGLTLSEVYNEEMGVFGQLDLDSYAQIRRLCDESRKVTRKVVEAFRKAMDESQVEPPLLGKVDLPPEEEKKFLVSELPASASPKAFLDAARSYVLYKEICPQMLHDVGTFKLTQLHLSSVDLEYKIIKAFQSQFFIKRIVEKIRSEPYMNFGAVTAFVHNIAQDVPLPYRSNIKEAISRLYAWLVYCFDDLSWSVPGAQSQVIKSALYTEGAEHALRSSISKKRR